MGPFLPRAQVSVHHQDALGEDGGFERLGQQAGEPAHDLQRLLLRFVLRNPWEPRGGRT